MTECGRQRSKVKTLLLQLGALRKFRVTDSQTTRDQIASERRSKRAWSNCEWKKVQTRVIKLRVKEGPNARDQIASERRSKRAWSNCVLCIPFILYGSPNKCWLTYMQRMRSNNLEIRITGSSCRSQLFTYLIRTFFMAPSVSFLTGLYCKLLFLLPTSNLSSHICSIPQWKAKYKRFIF